MIRLRRWFHDQGFKHQRNMSLALASVEASAFHVRESRRTTMSTQDREAHARQGWLDIRNAIKYVVDCGCDRDMWSEQVQEAIPE